MPELLPELLMRKGALGALSVYGLDQMLTDQDDPWLWAEVLLGDWPEVTLLSANNNTGQSLEQTANLALDLFKLLSAVCLQNWDEWFFFKTYNLGRCVG